MGVSISYVWVSFLMVRGYRFLRLRVSFFKFRGYFSYDLGVSISYVWGLGTFTFGGWEFLRLGVSFLTFGG